ncbi:UNVERIFIED_ORG: hypothetical protein EDC92_1594 [Dietzia maris]|jgi:hypothetical protein|uniref:hypothetical protein n=1 Tax=Dietzia TaxID=37914 RepID=UPI0010DBABA6|nr:MULTISPECIES: hypothetical protein [unclassified Dietzia]MCY1656007.1 hypothetical protein [Dietzia sp. SL131]
MTTTAPPTPDDEPTGPAAAHARRYGKPTPVDPNTLTGPAAAHARRYPKENNR